MKISIVLSTQPASFSALAYTGEIERHIRQVADLGYHGVELAVRDPDLLDVSRVRRWLDQAGLQVPAIGTGQAFAEEGLSFTHPEEDVRRQAVARIKRQIELAAEFDALVILGLIRGRVETELTRDQAEQWLVEALQTCSQHASEKGVRLALEPINRYETDLINTVDAGLQLIRQVGSSAFGLLLDTFHMNIEEPSIEASIRKAGQHIFHFHVADSNRWYPGAGHLDFSSIVAALSETGYTGYLSAEIMPLPDPDTCAARTIETMLRVLT